MPSNIYDKLSELYKIPLVDVARKMGYSDSNILILNQDFDELKKKYPDVWTNISSCKHHRDSRTPEEYALDLVSSWVFEDTIFKYCSKSVNITLNGSDSDREILSTGKVLSSSDFKVSERFVELINSYTKYWSTNKQIDLRGSKYLALKSKKSIILCADVYNKDFFLIDLKENKENAEYIDCHQPYGGKSAYRLDISNVDKYDLSIINIVKCLKKIE